VLAELNFVEYQEVVGQSLSTTRNGTKCVANIATAMAQVGAQLQTPTGAQALEVQFSVCKNADLEQDLDAANFVSTLASNFDGIVQYSNDNRAFEGGTPPPTMEQICDMMVATADPVANMAAVNEFDSA
jgi:hypothetical protein